MVFANLELLLVFFNMVTLNSYDTRTCLKQYYGLSRVLVSASMKAGILLTLS